MKLKEKFTFIHSDNLQYHFATEKNDLNNMQMYTFNKWKTCLASNTKEVKTIIKNIRKKRIIIEGWN